MDDLILLFLLVTAYVMVSAKRINALISCFMIQSFFLSLSTLSAAVRKSSPELYLVALLVFSLKVILVPFFLRRITAKIKVNENLGLVINPELSLLAGLGMTYLAWMFAGIIDLMAGRLALTVSAALVMTGLFIMIFRVKAMTQIIGLLVMENGIFLLAAKVCGGMPFFVEIAVFMDVLLSVMIMEVFTYRIKSLFTHVDTSRLTHLKG